MSEHRDGLARTGVGRYFGSRSGYASLGAQQQRAWLTAHSRAGTTPRPPVKSDCITWAMENLQAAYAGVGRSSRWAEIASKVTAQRGRGDVLAKELVKDGWTALYWNPNRRAGKPEDRYTAQQSAKGVPYYGIPVSGLLVDYRGKVTPELARLREASFFFGLAEGGKHTFVGRHGKVNEFHWASEPNDKHAIEETPLEQFSWGSGVVLVPPGVWQP